MGAINMGRRRPAVVECGPGKVWRDRIFQPVKLAKPHAAGPGTIAPLAFDPIAAHGSLCLYASGI